MSAAARAAAPAPERVAEEGVRIPGVEEPLPAGERVLWTGRPAPAAVARHVFRVRTLAAYFAAVGLLRVITGGTPAEVAAALGGFALVSAAALAVFGGLSRWVARSTTYAITDRRVVMRIGMAMPATVNVPLRCIESAGVRRWADGSGEIALTLGGTDRLAYALLWPHARPWRFSRPEPALRGLADPDAVGAVLRAAVAAAGGEPLAVPADGVVRPPAPPVPAPRPALAGR